MTTEEKAKAYDMALEGARKELGVDRKEWEVVQRVLHNIFPELVESENERIRKELIRLLSKMTDGIIENYTPIPLRNFIDYLEKQEEQKHADEQNYYGFSHFAKAVQKVVSMITMLEQKHAEGREYSCPNCGTSACCDDERFEIIAQAKRDIIEKTNIAENELSMELPLLDGILMRVWQVGWLNKKPAEWSEKDEKNLELVTDCVYEFYPDPVMKYKLKDWLTQWLKSLPMRCPKKSDNWKPSGEQMGALEGEIKYCYTCGMHDRGRELQSLYEQLTKL